MTGSLREELQFARSLTYDLVSTIQTQFHGPFFRVIRKADGSELTPLDEEVSDKIVAAYKGHKDVLSEEGGTANYGQNNIIVTDPIDSTSDLIAGQRRQPRFSVAATSIALWQGGPVMGVVSFPLLTDSSIVYAASKNGGLVREYKGQQKTIKVDSSVTKGVVLVSPKLTPAIKRQISAIEKVGLTAVPAHAAVFKACVIADNELLDFCKIPFTFGKPIVGLVSTNTRLYDIAATARIVQEAGGVTSPLVNKPGKQFCIMANNKEVYDKLHIALKS